MLFRTPFFATLFAAFLALAPSFAYAHVPPPAVPGTHPAAVPPTTAPAKPLPATPLPNGSFLAPTASSAAVGGPATTTGPGMVPPGNRAVLVILTALGILILAGFGWFLTLREERESLGAPKGRKAP